MPGSVLVLYTSSPHHGTDSVASFKPHPLPILAGPVCPPPLLGLCRHKIEPWAQGALELDSVLLRFKSHNLFEPISLSTKSG